MPRAGHDKYVTRITGATQCLLAALAMSAVAAGCGGSSKPAASKPTATAKTRQSGQAKAKPPSDSEALQDLLRTRARAIQDGDPDLLAGTSVGAQQTRDRRQAKWAAALSLGPVELSAGSTKFDAEAATMHVQTTYDFDGVDSRFLVRSAMTLAKTPEGWRVKRDRPTGVEAPWQHGRYVPHRSPHFLALTPKGLRVAGLMRDLEAGRAKMKAALPGVRPPSRLLVVVTRGNRDTRALTRDVRALGSLTAIAEASVDEQGPAKRVASIAGQRLVVIWRSYGRDSRAGRRETIAHEMTHASLLKRTSGRMPVWLIEGMAMYASGDERYGEAGALLSGAQLRDNSKQAAAKRTLSLTALGRPTSMAKLSSTPLAFAYSYSAAAAYAIAAKHGRKGLLKLYDGFNDEKITGRAGRKLMDRVMRRTLHQSFKSVQSDVDAYARAHARVG
jgi:hypothetical protein